MVTLLPRKDAVPASNLDLAREALVPELGAAGQVGLAARLDLGALQHCETVVVDVALAVVALVRARLGEELVRPLPLGEPLGAAFGEDVWRPNANAKRAGVGINWASASAFLASARAARSARRPGSPNAVVKILGTWMLVTVWPPWATWFPPPRDGAGAALFLPKPPKADAPTARARTSFIVLTCATAIRRCDVASAHESQAESVSSEWGQLRAVRAAAPADKNRSARRSMLQNGWQSACFLPCVAVFFTTSSV